MQMYENNKAVSNQLALVSQTDKYLDIDQKIHENYRKSITDKGWARDKRTAAKLPPSILFGLPKGDPLNNMRNVRSGEPGARKPQESSHYFGAKSKSRQTYKFNKGYLNPGQSNPAQSYTKPSTGGLGFSLGDIGSMGINMDFYQNGKFNINSEELFQRNRP